MSINYVTEILILVICLISLVTDLKKGIVRNGHLLIFGTVTIVLNIMSSIMNNGFAKERYFIPVIIGIVLSLVLFFAKMWAGGDCKLYMVIVLSMPYYIVERQFRGVSLVIYIPVVAFFFGYIYIILDSILNKIKNRNSHEKGNVFKKSFKDFFQYLKCYLAIILVNYILTTIANLLNIQITNPWVMLLINVIFVMLIKKIEVLKYTSVVITLIIIDVVLGILNFESLINMQTFLTWLAIIVSSITRNFVDRYNYEAIDIDKVKPGMILSTESSIILANDKLSKFKKISDETLKSRLTSDDVEAIFNFSSKRQYISKVNIVKKIPFALFIALATTIILIGGKLI